MKTKRKSAIQKTHFSYEERVKIETYPKMASAAGHRTETESSEDERLDEVRRNGVEGEYLARKAAVKTHQRYWRARHQHLKVIMHDALRQFVEKSSNVIGRRKALREEFNISKRIFRQSAKMPCMRS